MITSGMMELRRPNRLWLETMESFVAQIVRYLKDQNLYADCGGLILLSQIETYLTNATTTMTITTTKSKAMTAITTMMKIVQITIKIAAKILTN